MPKIHSSSIVVPGAELAADVEVGPFCTVGPNVKMGAGNKLISHVVIDGHTTIGSNNTFFQFSSIGAVPQDLKYKGENTELIIGNHNLIRECVTLNLGTVQGGGKTVLGDHNLLMAYVHMGHDSVVGNHVIMANATSLAGHVIVEDYANIGGMTGITQFLRVGTNSFVGGQSLVDRDIPPFAVVVGQRPCEVKGANIIGMRRKGYKADAITAVNESLKLWKRTDVAREQCLLEIETQYGDFPEVKQLVQFIRKSESGCLR
ncbi:MAG: acyl-ACP--UDP-N-acetylglucosamine O-acyltransferase [Bdellovibrionales bacterium]|nr:acyl-ACP--UDP-N-acetylglucosamine O-acyltransferase [Bdellovibrionales bacterium]